MVEVRCQCCGQIVDRADLDAALERAHLTFTERRLLDILRNRNGRWLTSESLTTLLYADDIDGGPDDAFRVVKVYICFLRKLLVGTGVTIQYRAGYGYRLASEPQQAVSTALAVPGSWQTRRSSKRALV